MGLLIYKGIRGLFHVKNQDNNNNQDLLSAVYAPSPGLNT